MIPRELTVIAQMNLESQQQPAWYFRPDGRLDMPKLLAPSSSSSASTRKPGWSASTTRRRVPSCSCRPSSSASSTAAGGWTASTAWAAGAPTCSIVWNYPGGVQRAVIELKLLRGALEQTLADGLAQTWAYADACGAEEAHLVIFDRTPTSLDAKIWRREAEQQGMPITVWGA